MIENVIARILICDRDLSESVKRRGLQKGDHFCPEEIAIIITGDRQILTKILVDFS